MAWNSAYRTEVLVYPATISEPTPKRREHLTYPLVAKITSFPSEILSECFKYFDMKNRKNNYFVSNIIKKNNVGSKTHIIFSNTIEIGG